MERSQARWVLWFSLTLGALSVLAMALAMRLPAYRDPPLDFATLKQGEYFDMRGLTRRQGGSLKLGFAEGRQAPPVALYGNHIVAFMGSDAFGAAEDPAVFFNYSYANLSLPEQVQLLRRVAARGMLPKQLAIIAITPPNADNGLFIIDYGNELPASLELQNLAAPDADENLLQMTTAAWRTSVTALHEVFNYNTLLFGAVQAKGLSRSTGPYVCARVEDAPPPSGWLRALPWSVRQAIAPELAFDPCDPESWQGALLRDGSNMARVDTGLAVNFDPLSDDERGLKAGDERRVAQLMRTLADIAGRGGAEVVFLITPVYETDRSDSVVNQIFNRALALAPELRVVDDRDMHDNRDWFADALHPGPAYYADLVRRLREMGLVDAPA